MTRDRQRQLINDSINEMMNEAFDIVLYGKMGLISKNEACDALWELLTNINYEIRNCNRVRIKVLMN
ncbi:hypothetical protein [Vulcanisaeta sp. JCM 16159]|uniref:hypothetical protein n=1 Tax=Vulcanisaeta sp. JCM 16159 TaxID=1295371 RepID=UPI0006D215D3|nr:hypothetical protein [Vulcanisaeta sp. JCM 16159]